MSKEQLNVDFLGKEGTQGELAAYSASNGLNTHLMRPWIHTDGKTYVTVFKGGDAKDVKNYGVREVRINGTLRKDEWKQLDEALVPIAESRLNGVKDLIDNGLTYNLTNAMGTTVLEWEDVSDAHEASLTMDGVTRSQGDRPVFSTNYLPIPIIHVDYEINARVLAASRNMGRPLDTTSAERAARKIALKLEQMLFTATSYTFGGGTIYGYLNYPDRNTVALSTPWDNSAKTGAQIVAQVRTLKQTAINDYHYGPWKLYIPTAYETVMDKDYDSTTPGTTIRERILKIGGISDIKVVDTLTANTVLLVQMTSDVVRLVRGMGLTNIQWGTEGNMVNKFKVMTIQVPQIRSDYEGHCGIVHATVS